MKIVLRVLIFVLLVGIVIEILILAPQELDDFDGDSLSDQKSKVDPAADQVMQAVRVVETSDGKREWELWADQALGYSSRGSWNAINVRVVFFSDDGLRFTVTGDRGHIKTNSKDMLIEGNVVTRTSNDYNFFTESMIYNSSARELTTTHPVRIKGPRDAKGYRMNLKGIGMRAELKESFIFIHKNVKGVRQLEPDRELKIRSDQAKLSSKSSEAFFYNNVEMIVDTQTITGPKARLQYDQNQSDLKKIEFEGGTRMSDENKWATSETIDIFVPEKKFVMEGSPRVVQNNDEIRGGTIIFLNGGKQFKVLNSNATVTEKLREKKF